MVLKPFLSVTVKK